ncbi:MAG: YfcE family phosphodiesterase [Candidatus Micrarchaeota archaeon]|nr:YfcE family phosphodiesterase [Candidatus Micrarchaeota archaeon]
MIKLFVAGDFHVPDRAPDIKPWILDLIKEEKPDYFLITGDLTDGSVLKYFPKDRTYVVQGNVDQNNYPLLIELKFGPYDMVLTHSHKVMPRGDKEQLAAIANVLRANVLIYGHTHKRKIEEYKGVLLLNPGTAAGAVSGALTPNPSSVMILEIGPPMKVKLYTEGKLEKEYIY